MVTFSCLIELRGKVDDMMGDFSEKIECDFKREDSEKDNYSHGLSGGRETPDKGKEGAPSRGGILASEKK